MLDSETSSPLNKDQEISRRPSFDSARSEQDQEKQGKGVDTVGGIFVGTSAGATTKACPLLSTWLEVAFALALNVVM